MSGLLHVSGPSGAGPGERQESQDRARAFLLESGVAETDIVRVDVPARGAGEEGDGVLRPELAAAVPMFQSGSLFGGMQGLEVVDAQRITAAEATILVELLDTLDAETTAVAFVTEGSLPAALAKFVKDRGTVVRVNKIWESNASSWLHEEIHRRGLPIDGEASAALIQRFGADTAALGQALDQLGEASGKITAAAVLDRFRNRPNEPIFHYTDAVTKGDVSEALRRLGDLLTHQHPLVILASLETELRRRSFALTARDEKELAELAGAKPSDRWVGRVWRQRHKLKDSSMRRGLDALVRADRVLKSQPEELHRVTLERLTVAMCRWMVGR